MESFSKINLHGEAGIHGCISYRFVDLKYNYKVPAKIFIKQDEG